MSVVAELTIVPVGTGESHSKYIAHAVEVVQKSGLDYKVGPMATVIEGEMDDVCKVLKQCQERLASDCNRMMITLQIDWRKTEKRHMDDSVTHVMDCVGKA